MKKFELKEMIKRYKTCYNRDDKKLESLDDIDFFGFIWNLSNGHYEICLFKFNYFKAYFILGDKNVIDLINLLPYRKEDFINMLNDDILVKI